MTGSIRDYTKYYRLILPEFDVNTWHDYMYNNFKTIDSILNMLYGVENFKGLWQNSVMYEVGDKIVDPSSQFIYVVEVAHTTPGEPTTFEDFYATNPTFYGIDDTVELSKQWAIKLDGLVNSEDYSAKAWAIGDSIQNPEGSAKYFRDLASAILDDVAAFEVQYQQYLADTQAAAASAQSDAASSASSATVAQDQATAAAMHASDSENSAIASANSAANALTSENNSANNASASSASALAAAQSASSAGFDLWDIKITKRKLNGASSQGWLMQGMQGSKATYIDAYNDLYSGFTDISSTSGTDVYCGRDFGLVDNGVSIIGNTAKNFLANRRITTNISASMLNAATSWSIVIRTKYVASSITQSVIGVTGSNNTFPHVNIATNGIISFYVSSTGSSWNITGSGTVALVSNTDYYIRLSFTGTVYKLETSIDNIVWTMQSSVTSSAKVVTSADTLSFGNLSFIDQPVAGLIYIDTPQVYINNIIQYQPWIEVPYVKTADEKKIVNITDGVLVDNLIAATDVNPYFRIDTTNELFILPLNNSYFKGTNSALNLNLYGQDQIRNMTGTVLCEGVAAGINGVFAKTGNSLTGANSGPGSDEIISYDPSRQINVGGYVDVRHDTVYVYYKVGASIQNAAVIDANGALLDIADLQSEILSKADNTFVQTKVGVPNIQTIGFVYVPMGTTYTVLDYGWITFESFCLGTNVSAVPTLKINGQIINSTFLGRSDNATSRVETSYQGYVGPGDVVELLPNTTGLTSYSTYANIYPLR